MRSVAPRSVDVERDTEVQQRGLGGSCRRSNSPSRGPLSAQRGASTPAGTTSGLENLVVEDVGLVVTELAERCGPIGFAPPPLTSLI